jgi:hypothetical protein
MVPIPVPNLPTWDDVDETGFGGHGPRILFTFPNATCVYVSRATASSTYSKRLLGKGSRNGDKRSAVPHNTNLPRSEKNGSKRSTSSTRAELVADNQASVPESLGWGEGECAAHARDCAVAFSPHHGAPREGPARGKRGEWPAWRAGSLARGAAAFGRRLA